MSDLRLLCDENIPGETVTHLRELGVDVTCVQELDMSGAPDDQVLATAIADERSLLTFNADFSDIRRISGIDHHGIIRIRTKLQTAEMLNPLLVRALKEIGNIELANVLVTVKTDSIRYR